MTQLRLNDRQRSFLRRLSYGDGFREALAAENMSELEYHGLRNMLGAKNETHMVAEALRKGLI